MRRCASSELANLLEVQSQVLGALPDPDLLEGSSAGELETYLAGGGDVIGAYENGTLAGYGIYTSFPDSDPRLRSLGTEVAELYGGRSFDLGVLDTVAVHPDHRGHGLQGAICAEIHRLARSGGAKVMMTTVSPQNQISIKNFARLGYKPVFERLLYGGKARSVLAMLL